MNDQNLNLIIRNYIDKFDLSMIGETYKWVAVQHFQSNWSIEADNFKSMFKNAVGKTSNMIDSKRIHPTNGIAELATFEEETVREMFQRLFVDDGGDLVARQNRINDFISQSDLLRQKYVPDKWSFKQDVRTVICYLNLRYPDDNFLYKYSIARPFAQYVDYVNDIGTGGDFRLRNYYNMCEQLVNAINKYPELLEINQQRLNETTWADNKFHLLAADIIYCAVSNSLFQNIVVTPKVKKSNVTIDKQNQISDDQKSLLRLKSELKAITDQKNMMDPKSLIGLNVQHNKFGLGKIIDQGDYVITVRFGEGDKKLGLPDAFTNKMMSTSVDGIKEYYEHLTELLKEEKRLTSETRGLEFKLRL